MPSRQWLRELLQALQRLREGATRRQPRSAGMAVHSQLLPRHHQLLWAAGRQRRLTATLPWPVVPALIQVRESDIMRMTLFTSPLFIQHARGACNQHNITQSYCSRTLTWAVLVITAFAMAAHAWVGLRVGRCCHRSCPPHGALLGGCLQQGCYTCRGGVLLWSNCDKT